MKLHWQTEPLHWQTEEPLMKNWHVVSVPRENFCAGKLAPPVREWIAANTRLSFAAQFTNTISDSTKTETVFHCRVLFRSRKDAALFRMFWG
jgi:rhodanese-related sulfurtransferase